MTSDREPRPNPPGLSFCLFLAMAGGVGLGTGPKAGIIRS